MLTAPACANVGRMTPFVEALTPREHDVLKLLALGHTNREVGGLLHISIRTAEFHRASIQRKLGLKRRADLVLFVQTHELID